MRVAIIDNGLRNLGSNRNMLVKPGVQQQNSNHSHEIASVKLLIRSIPSAFSVDIINLNASGILTLFNELVFQFFIAPSKQTNNLQMG